MAIDQSLTKETLSDDQLIANAQNNQEWAWDELVRRYYGPVLRHLTRLTREPVTAADLAQEVFLSAFELIHRLPVDRPFAPWLYRIAQYRVRRYWHRLTVHETVSLDWLMSTPGQTVLALCDPGDLQAATVSGVLVSQALAELSPSSRNVLLLSSFAGLTAPEVAVLLGISLAATERRISRAKERFREHYDALAET